MISVSVIIIGIVIAAFPNLSVPLRRRITSLHGLVKRSLQFVIFGTRISALLFMLGVVMKRSDLINFSFSISMLLFTLVFIIPGFIIKIIGAEEKIFPKSVKIIIISLLILGFLGVLPEILGFYS